MRHNITINKWNIQELNNYIITNLLNQIIINITINQ
jgi:hypothetical protein